jgi:hypothetical protein
MKKEVVSFVSAAVGMLALCVQAQEAIHSSSPASGGETKTVDDLATNPSAYLGKISIVGVVAAIMAGKGFTLVDSREYEACGLSCVNEPDTRKIPVRWEGSPPKLEQAIRVTGLLEKSDRGLIFSAETVAEAGKE